MTIRVHIERLVIDRELGTGAVAGIGRDLRRELGRLLADRGLSRELRDGAALPSVRGGSMARGRDHAAVSVGSRLARAVYEGIGDET